MLIILAWHQIINRPYTLGVDHFYKQIDFLKKNLPIIKKIEDQKESLSVLLTFDDATIDFYVNVFPFLEKEKINATLAVPTNWIPRSLSLSVEERLSLLQSKNPFAQRENFCSLDELKMMQKSKHIEFAAHGHHHLNLKFHPDEEEIIKPKIFFEKELSQTIDTFIFPYGSIQPNLQKLVQKHYRYPIRIGSASNYFSSPSYYYRVVVDNITDLSRIFTKKSLLKFLIKEGINRIRKI